MAEKQFVLDLAKLLVAVGWADGTLSQEETNALKDLLFQIPDISGEEWTELEMYMDSPVSPEERERLVKKVVEGIRWTEEKQLVLDTVTRLVEADGESTQEEKDALAQIRQDVEGARTGLLAHMVQAVRGAVGKRQSHVASSPSREDRLDEFIKNRVYYHLVSELETRGQTIALSDGQIRKLCLAAGLMAHVALIDHTLSPAERETITQTLQTQWKLSAAEARIVTEISCSEGVKGLDVVRLTRNYFQRTNGQERVEFVRCLFHVANAAQKTSFEEIKAIQLIAKCLKVPHREFVEAKLTIPREDRKGM